MGLWVVPGPCKMTWGGSDMGSTLAGILLRPQAVWNPITDDAHGTEPVDYILAGKSVTIECQFNNMDAYRATAPTIANLFNYVKSGGSGATSGGKVRIGEVAWDLTSLADWCQPMTITDRKGRIWTAQRTVPIDPQLVGLTSTREVQLPVAFLTIPDVNMNLVVPPTTW